MAAIWNLSFALAVQTFLTKPPPQQITTLWPDTALVSDLQATQPKSGLSPRG